MGCRPMRFAAGLCLGYIIGSGAIRYATSKRMKQLASNPMTWDAFRKVVNAS